jgi:signal transduction histidine kinase
MDDGILAGIISERDIIAVIARDGSGLVDLTADHIMSRGVITCGIDTDLSDVLAQMSEHRIRHMPVVSEEKVVGLVSVRDVLDFQRQLLRADITRREQDRDALTEAYNKLESAFEARTEEYRIARDAAEAANQAKTEFLANMSHELRTPLNAVIGFSEVMRTEALGPIGSSQYHEYAKDINTSGRHLLSLINDLLDMSKVEAGKEELIEEAGTLESAVAHALRLLSDRIDTKEIATDLQIDQDMPLLWADQRKIKQILTNLLSNATKFTPRGGTITVKGWCRSDSGFVVQVADSGIGIAPEDIPKALSKFGQIDSNLSRDYDGTGLGLPLAKSHVELHGGSFDLQSEKGVGTTVTLRFPASRIVKDKEREIVA